MDIINSIGNTLNLLANGFMEKIWILIGSAAIAFFTHISGLLFACFALNIADLITALEVSVKQEKPITSKRIWLGTLTKMRQESILIAMLHIIEHFAMAPTFGATTIISGGVTVLICLTEIWSIIENLNTINPDGPWRILKTFLKHKGEELTGIEIDLNDGKVDNDNIKSSKADNKLDKKS